MIDEYVIMPIIYLFIAFIFVVKVKHKVVGTAWEMPAKYLLVYPFVIFDWWVNVLAMSVVMLDPPDHLTELVTGRLKRYKNDYALTTRLLLIERWRYWLARFICKKLNAHDINHC